MMRLEMLKRSNAFSPKRYVRKSDGPVRKAHIRREVAPPVRRQIYERDKWTCQMCRCDVSEDATATRAQCDHKVPAERGGSSSPPNLQALCLQCNLKKRQACRHCDLPSCDGCPYAYPEAYDGYLVLRLSKEAAKKLDELSDKEGLPPAEVVRRLLDRS